jgi:hypothetical protein
MVDILRLLTACKLVLVEVEPVQQAVMQSPFAVQVLAVMVCNLISLVLHCGMPVEVAVHHVEAVVKARILRQAVQESVELVEQTKRQLVA